ncbi:MAG: hypothetical protein ING19_12905 [Azospirillum sp.]|nr:hypothetical protein [Azospirillum sp.]
MSGTEKIEWTQSDREFAERVGKTLFEGEASAHWTPQDATVAEMLGYELVFENGVHVVKALPAENDSTMSRNEEKASPASGFVNVKQAMARVSMMKTTHESDAAAKTAVEKKYAFSGDPIVKSVALKALYLSAQPAVTDRFRP